MMRHSIYKTGDVDAPAIVKDSNGDVVLSMCRNCGLGESELDEDCKFISVSVNFSQFSKADLLYASKDIKRTINTQKKSLSILKHSVQSMIIAIKANQRRLTKVNKELKERGY